MIAAAQKLPIIAQTGHTVKVEQLNGPCDWSSWDPKTQYGTPGPCGQTAAQAYPSQVLAQGLGYSFEDTATGNLMLLFGDTVGYDPSADPSAPHLRPDPAKGSFPPTAQFHAKDTMAMSTTTTAGNTFSIQYYTSPPPDNPSAPLFITEPGKEYLPPQPDGEQPSYVGEEPDGRRRAPPTQTGGLYSPAVWAGIASGYLYDGIGNLPFLRNPEKLMRPI